MTAIVFHLFDTVNHNTNYFWSLMLAVSWIDLGP